MATSGPDRSVTIDHRFRGPPRSGNGGYTCGLLAAALGGPACVRLRRPPPLERALLITLEEGQVRLLDGEEVVAEGRLAPLELEVPEPPSFADAVAAAGHYVGRHGHAFPECFVCGPRRRPGDGLRIFAGAAAGPVLAAPWVPDASLADEDGRIRLEFLWAALDCPGAFAVLPLPPGVTVVLGELCAEVQDGLTPGEPCVVQGWPLGAEGRKRYAGTSVHTARGRLVARARATWIEVPLADWALAGEVAAAGGQAARR